MDAEQLQALGGVARWAADVEAVSVSLLGTLLNSEVPQVGLIMAGPMTNAAILDRLDALAKFRMGEDPTPVTRFTTAARKAMADRNKLMHSTWRTERDHATAETWQRRARLTRDGYFDTDVDTDAAAIEAVSGALKRASALGQNAYFVVLNRLTRTR